MTTLEQVRQELKPIETLREILGPYLVDKPSSKSLLNQQDILDLMCATTNPKLMAKLIDLYNTI